MAVKCVVFFLIITLVQQGLASNKYEYSYLEYMEYSNSALQAFGQMSGLKGFNYCRKVLFDALSDFEENIKFIAGFIPEAREAWRDYKECDHVKDPDAAVVCREATRLEYIDALKTRIAGVGDSFNRAIGNLAKLPACLFTKKF